jgi:hypothetical protein
MSTRRQSAIRVTVAGTTADVPVSEQTRRAMRAAQQRGASVSVVVVQTTIDRPVSAELREAVHAAFRRHGLS